MCPRTPRRANFGTETRWPSGLPSPPHRLELRPSRFEKPCGRFDPDGDLSTHGEQSHPRAGNASRVRRPTNPHFLQIRKLLSYYVRRSQDSPGNCAPLSSGKTNPTCQKVKAPRSTNARRNLVIFRLACCGGLRVSQNAQLRLDDMAIRSRSVMSRPTMLQRYGINNRATPSRSLARNGRPLSLVTVIRSACLNFISRLLSSDAANVRS